MAGPVFGPQIPEDSRQVVRSIDDDGVVVFGQVGIQEINFKGRFGALASSTTENTIAIGDHYFTLDLDTGMFRIGDDVLLTALDDPSSCFMWGEIIDKDTVAEPIRIRVYVDDISDLVGTYQRWEIQVVARPKPGIEKDTSQSSVDPFGDGPFTFEVTAGKFFPIGGQLLLKPLADRRVALLGRVLAFNGTTLVVEKNETNATGSQAYDSWAVALLDAPPADMPIRSINGLTIDVAATTGVMTISAGSVMDSTGSVLLTLPATITKNLDSYFAAGTGQGSQIRVPIAGTVTSAGNILTGTGTLFTTQLTEQGAPALYLNDYVASGGLTFSWFGSLATGSMMSYGTDTSVSQVAVIASDTSLNVGSVPGVTADTIYRGGVFNTASGSDFGDWYVLVIRRDADGHIDVCTCTSTPSGEPDLPAGYSIYRCIGRVFQQIDDSFRPVQHLYENNYPFAPNDAAFLVMSAAGDTRLKNEYVLTAGSHTSISISGGLVRVNLNSGAITNQIEKTTLVDDDLFLIADSEDSFNLKKVKNINAGGGGGGGSIPTDWGLITDVVTDTLDFGTVV